MANLAICAENPVTRAGLTVMAMSGSNDVIAQLESLSALSAWLQAQSVDLVVVELSKLDENQLNQFIQLADDLFYESVEGGSSAETTFVLLLLNDWRELSQPVVSKLSAEMLNNGLVSMLPMTVSANQMRDAIAAILNGLVILHPDLTDMLFTPSAPYFAAAEGATDALLEPLTAREIQVLNQLASGLTNKAIAKACNISEHTVKFHISAIFSKLGVASRTEAVAVSIRQGLVML